MKTLYLALLLAATAAHALSDSEKETLMTVAQQAYEQQDYGKARTWFEKAATQGHAQAQ